MMPSIARIAVTAMLLALKTAVAGSSSGAKPDEIWLCGGQSNMAFRVSNSAEGNLISERIGEAKVFLYENGTWVPVSKKNVGSLSAVAVAFAMERSVRTNKAIGICVAARGGTGIEAWLPLDAFPDTAESSRLKVLASDPEVLQAAREDQADFKVYGKHRLAKWSLGRAIPGSLFEELVRSLGSLHVDGVIWYQGESNASNPTQADEYRVWLEHLIAAYRGIFHNEYLPFVIVQLPDYVPKSSAEQKGWAIVQEAQAAVGAKTPFAVTVPIFDLGERESIHPRRKLEVGKRIEQAVFEKGFTVKTNPVHQPN